MRQPPKPGPPGYIFRPWITLRSGEVIYAKDYGLKAFRLHLRGNDDTFIPPRRRR
jgi:hypothetical protein